jgi:hypothetical protein
MAYTPIVLIAGWLHLEVHAALPDPTMPQFDAGLRPHAQTRIHRQIIPRQHISDAMPVCQGLKYASAQLLLLQAHAPQLLRRVARASKQRKAQPITVLQDLSSLMQKRLFRVLRMICWTRLDVIQLLV